MTVTNKGVFALFACCRDLVFIWSRLHLRAHPSRQGFLDECLDLASSATNVRAIFPFIKLVTTEVTAALWSATPIVLKE